MRDPWRAEAEEECLAKQAFQPSAFVEEGSELNGPGRCGMIKPLKVVALSQGFVTVHPTAQLGCPIVAGVEYWFEKVVQPQAEAWFGEPVVEIRQISAYSCRKMNNGSANPTISEHAFGNALDISTFKLQSGREVTVKGGWKGPADESGFLRNIHAQACDFFTTVLGPGADAFHYDHLHVDLSRRASGRSVCNPTPRNVPQPPRMSRGVPMAQRSPLAPPVLNAPPRQAQAQTTRGHASAQHLSPAERLMAANDPYAADAPREAPRDAMRAAPSQPASTSPFAPRPAEAPRGPSVIAREQYARPAGQPMNLGQQPPSHTSFGAPMAVDQRALQTFGAPAGMQRPVPPSNVGARKGDPMVTGSIKGEPKKATPAAKQKPGNLLSPKPMAEEHEGPAETLTVFNLPGARK